MRRCLLAFLLLSVLRLSSAARPVSIGGGWEYLVDRAMPDTAPAPVSPPHAAWLKYERHRLEGTPGLWLRRVLPDAHADQADFVFSAFVPRLAVYLDDALLYDYSGDASSSFRHELAIHVVTLPQGYAGKHLEIWIARARYHSFEIADPFLAAPGSVPGVVARLVNRQLRRELPNAAIGILTITAGLVVLALFFARRRVRDVGLIYLAGVSLPYGARLMMDSQWISLVIGEPREVWLWPVAFITYIIGIPCLLLARHALGPGWKSTLNFALYVQIAFSVGAILLDILSGTPMGAGRINGVWSLLFTLVVLANLFTRPLAQNSGLRALGIGFLVFAAAVINANVSAIGLPAWQPGGVQLEPYAFLVLLVCFGYYVAHRALRREEKLRAVEHELETARRIQQSILPASVPSVTGLEIAARYLPMTAVAGDFYDFVQVGPNEIGVLVADVSGHGVPAALVASMVKVAFDGQAHFASDPARLLAGMNEILHGRVQRQFVTAVYAFIDAGEGRLVYASAGHPWPLLRRAATNTIEPLKQGGLVLGPFRKTAYTNASVDLDPGDRLLLYTDGIVEASNSAEEFYGDRLLQEFLTRRGGQSPEQFTDELLQDVRGWSRVQNDDVTVVAVSFAGAARPASVPA